MDNHKGELNALELDWLTAKASWYDLDMSKGMSSTGFNQLAHIYLMIEDQQTNKLLTQG